MNDTITPQGIAASLLPAIAAAAEKMAAETEVWDRWDRAYVEAFENMVAVPLTVAMASIVVVVPSTVSADALQVANEAITQVVDAATDLETPFDYLHGRLVIHMLKDPGGALLHVDCAPDCVVS